MNAPTLILLERRYRDGEGEAQFETKLFLRSGELTCDALELPGRPGDEPFKLDGFLSDLISIFCRKFSGKPEQLSEHLHRHLDIYGVSSLLDKLPSEYEDATENDAWELQDTEFGYWTASFHQLTGLEVAK